MFNKFKIIFLCLCLVSAFVVVPVSADEEEGPEITLKASAKSVDAGKTVKVTVSVSEPLLKFIKDMVSIDGGNIESLRKLSPYSYLLFVRAEEGVKEVDIQVEGSKVQNMKKVYNTYASNNLIIKVINPAPVKVKEEDRTEISKLLDDVVQTSNNSNLNTTAPVSTPPVTYYNCNGYSIPTTQQCLQNTNQQVNPYSQYGNTTGYYDQFGNYYPPVNNSNVYYQPYNYYNSPYNYGYSPYSGYSSYSGYSGYGSYGGSGVSGSGMDEEVIYEEEEDVRPPSRRGSVLDFLGW